MDAAITPLPSPQSASCSGPAGIRLVVAGVGDPGLRAKNAGRVGPASARPATGSELNTESWRTTSNPASARPATAERSVRSRTSIKRKAISRCEKPNNAPFSFGVRRLDAAFARPARRSWGSLRRRVEPRRPKSGVKPPHSKAISAAKAEHQRSSQMRSGISLPDLHVAREGSVRDRTVRGRTARDGSIRVFVF